ncbi:MULTISPECIES: phage holin family protein [Stenotrophomonas]|uniref:phage holin family protein n=1 Tax=Stenotrophomonas TaxID=40323 RepID=UPI00107DF37B|nr:MULTISPECIES: phage holin family protein [Stenotrophomonas]EAB7134033.1 phage holin family protein [Salmonella enterica subsp. enterica serovar Enteritidis]MBN5058812.1 phage holin family protein [Stenotrophomonas maltophilia]MBN5067206.1 phage holin family protein [Stenotrophomonas maltophilia]MCW8342840.1 phage holin family protein [Stenotrophomonas sp. SG1]
MTEFLTAATLLCSVAICIRLLTYRPMPGANHRHGIAWCAWLLSAATGGQALQIILQGPRATVSVWQLVLLVVLLVATYRSRGNVAHLFGSR